MKGARATQHAYPGEFRRSQNWIGGKSPADASFVPPAPHDMNLALDDLEEFIHAKDDYPSLVKAGLLHAQFETIHPFTDGNGRTGRMLIAMYMHHAGLLELPVFYLEGVAEIAEASVETCTKITALRDRDFAKMQKLGKKSAESTLPIVRKLFGQPIVGVAEIMKWTGFSPQGSYNVINRLKDLKILEPLGDADYGQKYIYAGYYEIFDDAFRDARAKGK